MAYAGSFWENHDCVRSVPKATLNDKLYSKHSFVLDLKNGKGIEKVTFNDGLEMTIINSGCEYVGLTYQVTFPKKLPQTNVKYWYEKAAEIIGKISEDNTYSANLKKAIVVIGKYIKSSNLKYGEELEVSDSSIREFLVVSAPEQNNYKTFFQFSYSIGPL